MLTIFTISSVHFFQFVFQSVGYWMIDKKASHHQHRKGNIEKHINHNQDPVGIPDPQEAGNYEGRDYRSYRRQYTDKKKEIGKSFPAPEFKTGQGIGGHAAQNKGDDTVAGGNNGAVNEI